MVAVPLAQIPSGAVRFLGGEQTMWWCKMMQNLVGTLRGRLLYRRDCNTVCELGRAPEGVGFKTSHIVRSQLRRMQNSGGGLDERQQVQGGGEYGENGGDEENGEDG
jgi:hypothetical protein